MTEREQKRLCKIAEMSRISEFICRCIKFDSNLETTRYAIYDNYMDYHWVYDLPYVLLDYEDFFKLFKEAMDKYFCFDFTAYNKPMYGYKNAYGRINADGEVQVGLYEGLDIDHTIDKFIISKNITNDNIKSQLCYFFECVSKDHACIADREKILISSRTRPKGFCIAIIENISINDDKIVGFELNYSVQRSTPYTIRFNVENSILNAIPIIDHILKYGRTPNIQN